MIGTQIGHYKLERTLGRGGFGTVYRGVHAHLPSLRVAVKVIHENLSAERNFQDLLQKEVEVLHGLQHPGIVSFRDLVVEPGALAIVMELLEGVDLRSALRRGPFTPEETARILQELLETLDYAHSHRIVHRDIKPENIFLCSDGRIKLMDFGIAKVIHTTRASMSGMVSGTMDYMAPERFRQQSPPASDLYAVGLVGWELLSGQIACTEGDIPSKIGWHITTGPPDVREQSPDCPEWLAKVLTRLTARELEIRPEHGGAALRVLERLWPPPGPASSRPVQPRERLPRPEKRPEPTSAETLAPPMSAQRDQEPTQETWFPEAGVKPPASRAAGQPPPLPSSHRAAASPPLPSSQAAAPAADAGATGPPRSGPAPSAAPARRPSLFRELWPRGLSLVMLFLALSAGLVGGSLAGLTALSEPAPEQITTALGAASILFFPGISLFLTLAGMVDGRRLSRALYFSLAALSMAACGVTMAAAMLADGEEAPTAVGGGVCCGMMPMLLLCLPALMFLGSGWRQHRRAVRAWRASH